MCGGGNVPFKPSSLRDFILEAQTNIELTYPKELKAGSQRVNLYMHGSLQHYSQEPRGGNNPNFH